MPGLMSVAQNDDSQTPNIMSMMAGADPDTLSKLQDPTAAAQAHAILSGNAPPEVIAAAHQQAGAGTRPTPRLSSKTQTDNKSVESSGSKANIYGAEPGGTLDQLAAWTRGLPEYQAQAGAQQNEQDTLDRLKGQSSNAWIRPLSALADSVNGTHLADSAPDPNQRNAMILKYQDDLAKRKNDMMKSIMEGAQKLKTGSETQNLQSQINNFKMLGQNIGGGPNAQGVETPDKAHARVQALLEGMRTTDPGVQQAYKDVYASQKVQTLMDMYKDPNQAPNVVAKLIAAETGKIATNGVPSVHELEGLTPNTTQSMWASALSKIGGKLTPANVGEFLTNMSDYSKGVSNDSKALIKDRNGRIVDENQGPLGGYYGGMKQRYVDQRFGAPEAPAAQNDGIDVNMDLSKATPAQHAAYLKKFGGG
jgi:hypothetical protein